MSLMNKSVRLMIFLQEKKIIFIPKLLQWLNRVLFACDIPRTVKIGKGTIFAHSGLGCVIHEKAIIGRDCKIYQNVTIGGRGKSGTPIIKNNVFIGAGALILGKVIIEDNAIIGAGALVIKDVEEGQTVLGNLAKVVKQ